MALFRKKKTIRLNPELPTKSVPKRTDIPDNLIERCPKCRKVIFQTQLPTNHCCPHCQNHLQFPAEKRIVWLTDDNSFIEWDKELGLADPLEFPGYEAKLEAAQELTGLKEAVLTGQATLNQIPFAIGVMDSRFVMASMGTVVGEKLVRLFEQATEKSLSVVLYIASGGARMQEGILSLMQMAKVSQAVAKHSEAGLFYCAILTNPTTGGVTASFAMQGDMILAEPDATVGFAGKRVIEQTIKATLPKEFQKAESVLENGFIDQIVKRDDQVQILHLLLTIHQKQA